MPPAIASGRSTSAATSRRSQSGSATQSSSVNATKRPVAAATPAFRAAAGPRPGPRSARTRRRGANASTASSSATGAPSSTTTASTPPSIVCATRPSRQRVIRGGLAVRRDHDRDRRIRPLASVSRSLHAARRLSAAVPTQDAARMGDVTSPPSCPPRTRRPPRALPRRDRGGERRPDEVVVVDRPANAGPARARNAGAARTTGRRRRLRRRRRARRSGRLHAHQGALPRRPGTDGGLRRVRRAVATTRLTARFRNLLHHHVHARSAGPASTFWAGIGAVRRDAFERAGGFDTERYPRPSIEDVELGLRLATPARASSSTRRSEAPTSRTGRSGRWSRPTSPPAACRGSASCSSVARSRQVEPRLARARQRGASVAAASVLRAAPGAGRGVRPLTSCALNARSTACCDAGSALGAALASVPLHVAHHVAGARRSRRTRDHAQKAARRDPAVVFDLDGVLVDTEHLWDEVASNWPATGGATPPSPSGR